jgi:hypothetical protein
MSRAEILYDHVGPLGQSYVDRFRYRVGWLPRVSDSGRMAWPGRKKAALIISADFELAWAWRYAKGAVNTEAVAVQKAEQTRRNLPVLLRLFDDFGVPVTWATVGHLFLERCALQDGRAHHGLPRLPYFENEYWRFAGGDWFDADPCSDYCAAPAWYAPDLLRDILAAKTEHEIACHSFSHIDCSDEHCPPEVMDAELAECQRLASQWEIALQSFVFPGNVVGNFADLKRNGFTAYRWHGGYELDVPQQDALGLWQIPCGVLWEKPAQWPLGAWVKAMQKCADRALETGTVLHFWFHPSCDLMNVEAVFGRTLEYVASHRGDWWVTTMGGLSEQLASAEIQ